MGARRAVERIDVSSVCLVPEMVLYENLHPDLSLRHNRIIKEWRQCGAKQIVSFRETRLTV